MRVVSEVRGGNTIKFVRKLFFVHLPVQTTVSTTGTRVIPIGITGHEKKPNHCLPLAKQMGLKKF